jgi:hypothetical protein
MPFGVVGSKGHADGGRKEGRRGGGGVHINLKQGTFDANKACNDLLSEHGWFLGFRVHRQHGANQVQNITRRGVCYILGEDNTNCSSSWLFHLKL